MPDFIVKVGYTTETEQERDFRISAETKEEAISKAQEEFTNSPPENGAWFESWAAVEYTPWVSPAQFIKHEWIENAWCLDSGPNCPNGGDK